MIGDRRNSSNMQRVPFGARARRWSGSLRIFTVVLLLGGIPALAFGQEAVANAPVYGPSETPPPSPEALAAAAAEKAAAEKKEREAELQALRQELLAAQAAERARQDAEIARLRGEVETLRQAEAQAAQRAAEAPPVVSAARLGLGLSGFMQVDWQLRQSSEDQINYSTGAPINQDRFFIRRARLRTTLDRTYVAGLLEFDGNTVKGPTARISAAEASLKWTGGAPAGAPPLIMATMGLFKIPFGFEVGESDRDRLFLERTTTSRALFPGEYDLGARLLGGWRFLRYMVAVQNGEPVGETTSFPGLDPNHQKDFVGRGGVDSGFDGPVAVVAGVSFLKGTGFHKGTPATKPSIQWVDSNEDGNVDPNEIKRSPGTAATPSANFPRFGFGADLRITVRTPRLGDTTAYGEFYYAEDLDRGILVADPTGAIGAAGRSYRELGWYAAFMQDLGPHATVGVRYDYYNPDRDANDLQMGVVVPNDPSYSTVALVGALRAPSGRLIVEYDINRNHLGRDSAGLPTNLQDNAFTIRGEVRF